MRTAAPDQTGALDAVARWLSAHTDRVFGLVGSGNFHLVNALTKAGIDFVAARHEGGAATMADAYARISQRTGVLTVHQGPGFTNALTGLAEAAKSRTPLLALVPEATMRRSNFYLDTEALARGIGAHYVQIASMADLPSPAAVQSAGTMVLGFPLHLLAGDAPLEKAPAPKDDPAAPSAEAEAEADADPDAERLASLLTTARRPLFIAGHGAVRARAREALIRLADRCGALLAVSARAKGLFTGHPFYLDVSGGFASPLTAELVQGADLVVAWGASLSMWTTRHGKLVDPSAKVAQVLLHAGDLGTHHRLDCGVAGDVRLVAERIDATLQERNITRPGYRSEELRTRIATQARWRDVPYDDDSSADRIDPRTLTVLLDDILPTERTVAVDSGNFMGYPAMYLQVPDEQGFCFSQAFQSIGLGLATAIGAALARPDRLPVAALGDGGFLMGVSELETVVRLKIPMLVVVYDDAAYGAEVHHFGPDGHPLAHVTFPERDLASIARGFGFQAATVRTRADLAPLQAWLAGPRDEPFLLDAKITSRGGAWWLREAFGH
ncbi:thiamine pyrophosphate-binding protein [Pendulispora brunnea]|uniref:Thiamine pyrophosphate-binding protein n=1 Tax=Pendulispora brunnea TaxID=2905690 RepID=A0ABZ2JXW0_9BACT